MATAELVDDQLVVSGSASLGGTLLVTEDAAYSRGTVAIDLITAGNGISGNFASINTPDTGYLTSIAGNAFRLSFNAVICGGICWDGGAGTILWTDAANWTGNVLPGLNDLVFINLGNRGQVMVTGGAQRIAELKATGCTFILPLDFP